METDRKWIIVRIDGKIAAISTDYRQLAAISTRLAKEPKQKHVEITARTIDFEEVWKLRQKASWEDLMLFGTDFQKKVWRKLWELTHSAESADSDTPQKQAASTETASSNAKLICYSDFAELCQNRAGVRAVAHAIGLNPVSVIIPCHLVIPKESIDRIREIRRKAESTIFKGDDLCMESILNDPAVDFGEYALGKALKRKIIIRELSE